MNGEIKLTTGPLQLNTQDGVDKVLNKPIINDGSNGKLVLLLINIKEPSKPKPMLHAMSNTTDESTFMAAHHITLNGVRTCDQSRALQEAIYQKQMVIYKKGLGLLTYEQRRANGLLRYTNGLALLTYEQHLANYKKGLGLLTYEQRHANGLLGYANGLALLTYKQRLDHLVTKVGMHDLAMGDTVVHGNYNGTGIVKL